MEGAQFPAGTEAMRAWLMLSFHVTATNSGRCVRVPISKRDRIEMRCKSAKCSFKVTVKRRDSDTGPVWLVTQSTLTHAESCEPSAQHVLKRETVAHLLLVRRRALQPYPPKVSLNYPLDDLRRYTFAEVHHDSVNASSDRVTRKLGWARRRANDILQKSWPAEAASFANGGFRDDCARQDFQENDINQKEPWVTNIVRYKSAHSLRVHLKKHPWAVHFTTQNGSTPLHKAAYDGLVDHVRELLSAGARPWVCTGGGFSPVDHARYASRRIASIAKRKRPPMPVDGNAYGQIVTLLQRYCKAFCCPRCMPAFCGSTSWDHLESHGDASRQRRHKRMRTDFDERIEGRLHNLGRGRAAQV